MPNHHCDRFSQPELIHVEAVPTGAKDEERGKVRYEEPQRRQGKIVFEVPEDTLDVAHPARLIWSVLGTLDLGAFGRDFSSVEGHAGRAAKSPRMMLTLWLYAISRGNGSARRIAELVETELAYRWIVGDVKVSHHKLSEFRVAHGEALDELFSDVLASLMEKGLLDLQLVAQDGTRTRAAAAAPSFRSLGSLLECRAQAALHLKAVLASADDPEHTRAQSARRQAAARDFQARVEAAIQTATQLQATRTKSDKPARASTTDAEARVMKMGDGGFRPAFNVQYAVAGSPLGGPRTIVGVGVNNVGSDMNSLTPMVRQIEQRTGQVPGTLLADGGHENHADIAAARRLGVDVIVPPSARAKPLEQMRDADPEVIAWRERMETAEAKKLYKARAGLAELANANQKEHQGVTQVLVRGVAKVTSVALLGALAANILQHATNILA